MVSILHREMRVASRKRWTFRVRLMTNIVAFVLTAPLLLFGSPDGVSGATVFRTLTWAAFFFCLIQGVRQAANSIADEKREGTLGLLFLTDLRSIDIIFGKLSAIIVPMLQPLMAFVPFLTISMLLGGVTFGEVARVSLVFATLILFSVSIGLFISSVSRRAEGSGNSTLVLLLIMVFLPRALAYGPLEFLLLATPWTAFARVGDGEFRMNPPEFWWSLLITFAIGLLALLGAAFFLPRRWEQFEAVVVEKKKTTFPKLNRRISTEDRARILDRSPGEWLALRHSMSGFSLFLFNFAVATLSGVGVFVAFETGGMTSVGFIPVILAMLLVLLRIASQASYPLADAKRSGAIEMLISTPLQPATLIRGQITAMWKQFRLAIAFMLGSALTISAVAFYIERSPFSILPFSISVLTGAIYICSIAAMGMWMGLREKTPNAAFFKTILFALIIPSFFMCGLGPILQIILLAVSWSRLTGKELRRLVGAEQPVRFDTLPPIIPDVRSSSATARGN